MIGSNQNIGSAKLIDNDAYHIFQLRNRFLTSRKDSGIGGMACFINGIMVNVDHFHALYQSTSVSPFHADDVLVLQRHTCRVGSFQNFVTVGAGSGLPICQYGKQFVFYFNRKFGVRKQSSHPELGDRRENALHILELHLALILSLQFFRKGSRHFIPHRIRNNHKHSGICIFHTAAVEIFLMRDFHDFPIFSQFLRTDIRPVIPKFAQEPVGIQPFHLVYNVLKQIIQQDIGGFQTSLEAKVKLPVIAIHLIIIFRIVLPDFTRLCQMKSGRMFFEELLHLRHLQNTIVEVGKAFIPGTGTAFFHYFRN